MFATLAKMLGIPRRMAEDAIVSEPAAKATLSRRGLLLAGATALPFMAAGNLFSDIDWYRGYQKIWVSASQPWAGGVFDAPVLIEGDTPLILSGGSFAQGVRVIAPVAHISGMYVAGILPDGDAAMKIEFQHSGGSVMHCHVDLSGVSRRGVGIDMSRCGGGDGEGINGHTVG